MQTESPESRVKVVLLDIKPLATDALPMRPAMRFRARLRIARLPGVLQVPLAAIESTAQGPMVNKLGAGAPQGAGQARSSGSRGGGGHRGARPRRSGAGAHRPGGKRPRIGRLPAGGLVSRWLWGLALALTVVGCGSKDPAAEVPVVEVRKQKFSRVVEAEGS